MSSKTRVNSQQHTTCWQDSAHKQLCINEIVTRYFQMANAKNVMGHVEYTTALNPNSRIFKYLNQLITSSGDRFMPGTAVL